MRGENPDVAVLRRAEQLVKDGQVTADLDPAVLRWLATQFRHAAFRVAGRGVAGDDRKAVQAARAIVERADRPELAALREAITR